VALRGYFRRAVGRHDLAEDLTQEVFLRVVRATDQYQARGRERAWLFTIAHRVLIDHFRRRKASPVALATAAPGPRHHAELTDVEPAGVPATQELRVVLEDALLRLPDEDREIFLLAELAGLSYAEIADACASTHAAVRSRVYRARLALRAALAPSPSQPRR
jgi:RNA polymerase sigma-70 factor (ECF subfamily)